MSSSIESPISRKIELQDASLEYFPTFFSPSESTHLLNELTEKIDWVQNKIRFYGKESLVPRLEAWYGDPGKSYSYSGIQMNPKPWTPELQSIKQRIESLVKIKFNSVLINFYRDGKDRVAWHSDDEKELGQNPVIGSISLGERRRFKLRHRKHKENGLNHEIMLENGSLLLMTGPTQHHWMHEIPRTAKTIGSRINLTFRIIR